MLTVNIYIQDRLINGQTGVIWHIEFAQCTAHKVYVKSTDEQTDSKAMRSSYLGRENSWVLIEKCETPISKKKESVLSSNKHTQFQLTLTWVSTVHKVQGISLD